MENPTNQTLPSAVSATTVRGFYKCLKCGRERRYQTPPTECRFCGEPVAPMPVVETLKNSGNMERKRSTKLLRFAQVKRYALKVSKEKRSGFFTRFSTEFYVACEAEVAGKVASLTNLGNPLPADDMNFSSPHGRKVLSNSINRLAQGVIHGKVMRHPSVGKTLKD